MKEIAVEVPDKPGELARVSEALAEHGINIRSISTETTGRGMGLIKIVPEGDDEKVARVLTNARFKVRVNPILVVQLIDRPGELLKFAREAFRNGLNISSVTVIGNVPKGRSGRPETTLAVRVDNFARAEKALKPYVVNK